MKVERFKRLLAANRSEIAIRIFRAAHELGLTTVALYSHEDRFALHRFKADEAYLIGEGKEPVKAYLDVPGIIDLCKEREIEAVHPGYGFLSENPAFAGACAEAGITFVGPRVELLEQLGDKTAARRIAKDAGVPILEGSARSVRTVERAKKEAERLGYPVMLKAAHGGGGRGMRVVQSAGELTARFTEAQRESQTAFGSDDIFVEKYLARARHIEVQILGDQHGNLVHLFDRDCSLQRRHQKIIEIAPALNVSPDTRGALCDAAVRIGKSVNYDNAGTVEFLLDTDTGQFYFIEINPRIQVEHTVTEVVTGYDLVRRQILVAQGHPLSHEEIGLPDQSAVRTNGYAFQCRITTEDPENNFIPDYGRLSAYRSAAGMGIRLDAGTAFTGAVVTPYYDSLLVKMTASGTRFIDAVRRMERSLQEFRVRGVKTNIPFLINLVNHPTFQTGECTTRFIDETPELFLFPRRRDRATRLLRFLAEVVVNGNPSVAGKPARIQTRPAPVPPHDHHQAPPAGNRDRLRELGPAGWAEWVRKRKPVLLTDTTMRDAHQSLLATRMRTHDMLQVAHAYAYHHAELFSLEMWGGATFDTAMRFLRECPWERLERLREAIPNIPFQMLLRASNAVGYTNYPDNVVRAFVREAAQAGIDVFRVFDCFNWTANMKVAMEEVVNCGAVCEGAICYTGDLLDPKRDKYDLDYYVGLAQELERMGAHFLAIKDMAGLCKPYAAYKLVKTLRQEVGLPVHFHSHDTSGGQVAALLKAAEAGVDILDAAMGPLSGMTAQPNLNTTVEMLRFSPRHTKLDSEALARTAEYWEVVRDYYAAFEAGQRSGEAEVYQHEMPGGQSTNLRQQAQSMGLGHRWHEIWRTYAAVNQALGDVVKVTPSSKVVGDLTLFMVTNDLTTADLLDPRKELSFPQSVIEFFEGRLGKPHGSFPKKLQARVLKGLKPLHGRPGASLPPVDLEETRRQLAANQGRSVSEQELMSHLMYPDVFAEFAQHRAEYGDVAPLPSTVFFYGLQPEQEIAVDIEPGKTLILKLVAVGETDADGCRTVFFEMNGQPRQVRIADKGVAAPAAPHRVAEPGNPCHLGSPMPGLVVNVAVEPAAEVKAGDKLLTIEAMKMETTLYTERDVVVEEVLVKPGDIVNAKDLLIVFRE